MKRMMILLVMALVMFTGNAFAADTATVTVNANVLAYCTFDTNTAVLGFGDIDPVLAPLANATQANIGLTCSAGASYSITAPGTVNIGNGIDTIAVSTALTMASGDPLINAAAAATDTLQINASIPALSYLDVSAGLYTNTFDISLDL